MVARGEFSFHANRFFPLSGGHLGGWKKPRNSTHSPLHRIFCWTSVCVRKQFSLPRYFFPFFLAEEEIPLGAMFPRRENITRKLISVILRSCTRRFYGLNLCFLWQDTERGMLCTLNLQYLVKFSARLRMIFSPFVRIEICSLIVKTFVFFFEDFGN